MNHLHLVWSLYLLRSTSTIWCVTFPGSPKGGERMGNLALWIALEAEGEEILGVVIGEFGWSDGWGKQGYEEEKCPKQIPWEKRGIVLPWGEARELLDYEFYNGYGAPECHAVYAWTKTKVIFVGTYDGKTWIESVPRNPTECHPHMVGGG